MKLLMDIIKSQPAAGITTRPYKRSRPTKKMRIHGKVYSELSAAMAVDNISKATLHRRMKDPENKNYLHIEDSEVTTC